MLAKGLRAAKITRPLSAVQIEIRDKLLQCWKVQTENVDVRLLTSVKNDGEVKLLHIYLVTGRGWLKYMSEFEVLLGEVAKEAGCAWLTGFARNRAMERVYDSFGAERHSVLYRKAVI